MKKILLLAHLLLMCNWVGAQNIDGFVLGESRLATISHIPMGFKYVTTDNPNKLQYEKISNAYDGFSGTSYQLSFKENKLCNITKHLSDVYRDDMHKTPEQWFADIYIVYMERFGNPTMQYEGTSFWYCYWTLPDSQLSFKFSWTIRQKEEQEAGVLFGPLKTRTYYYLNITIEWKTKESLQSLDGL